MPDELKARMCAFCRRQPLVEAWRPFCSERCKLQDLARWAEGTYRVAGEPPDEHERQNHGPTEDD